MAWPRSSAKFAFALLLLAAKYHAEEICEVSQQVFYKSPRDVTLLLSNGSLEGRGLNYPPGTFWKEENGTFVGCPCLIQKCIQHCSNLIDLSEASLNATRQVLLSSHHYYDEQSTEQGDRKAIKVKGQGWSTDDLFKEYYVVDERMHVDQPPSSYVLLETAEMTLESLEHVCFAFIDGNVKPMFLELLTNEDDALESSFHIPLAVCCSVSVASLVVLLAAFFITQESKFIHGKCIICHSICLMVAYVGLFINYLSLSPPGAAFCYLTGYVTYFAFMGLFFWLNVMCFDLYWSYSKRDARNSNEKKVFKMYSLYAWSCPTLLTFGLLLNQHFYHGPHDSFKVQLGESFCFLNTHRTEFFASAMTFIYGPLLIILLVNFGFFFVTLRKIYYIQRQMKTIQGASNSRNAITDINQLMMYIKLFSIMGGTWLMEFISWALESWSGIWHLFDIINCLKGLWLVIFCVFLSQRVRSKLTRHAIFCHCGQGAIITAQNSSKTTTSEKYDPIELASLAKKNYEIVDAQAA